MKPTLNNFNKLLNELDSVMHLDEKKRKAFKSQDAIRFFHRSMHNVGQCSSVMIDHPEAFDSFLAIAKDVEGFRGKGGKYLQDGYIEVFKRLVGEIQWSLSGREYSEETVKAVYAKTAAYLLDRVEGGAVRSMRAADMRADCWGILEDIAEFISFEEVRKLALSVSVDEKASVPERRGALAYVLADWNGEESDKDTMSVITQIRERPANRDFLYMVLNAEVQCGLVDEFGALLELEDWDEENE